MMEYHGRRLRLRLEGESHSPEMRVTIWGLPVGEPVDKETLLGLLARRRPGQSPLTTGRNEKDEPEFLSGAQDGMLTGEPVVIRFANEDRRPEDYAAIRTIPRPGHADYPQYLQGGAIPSGGGALGGRMTLLLCAAGGLALGLLKKKNITVAGRLLSVGGVRDIPLPVWPPKELLEALAEKKLPVWSEELIPRIEEEILAAKAAGDSLGGVIECVALGLPGGLGNPRFDGVTNRLAAALFAIPGVKGVEFGDGFAGAAQRGSEQNDPFILSDGTIQTETNHAGGLLGSITTGMPLVLRLAMKPTPSIAREQRSVDLQTMRQVSLCIGGRHDPCIAVRAVPVAEAVTALVLWDLLAAKEYRAGRSGRPAGPALLPQRRWRPTAAPPPPACGGRGRPAGCRPVPAQPRGRQKPEGLRDAEPRISAGGTGRSPRRRSRRCGRRPQRPPEGRVGLRPARPRTNPRNRKRGNQMELQELRNEINAIDGEMLALLERRLAVCRAIAEYKRQNGLPVRDPARETEKLHEAMERGGAAGQRLVALLMALGREEQERLLKGE